MPSATTARSDRPLDTKLLLKTLMSMRRGDFSVRLPIDHTGVAGKIYDTLNEILDLNQRMTDEFERVSTVVGKDGKPLAGAAKTSFIKKCEADAKK